MEIIHTKNFDTRLGKFLHKNPRYRNKIIKTLNLLSHDPNYSSLRLHKISPEVFSISVDMKIRILISFEKEGALLLTIGSHEEVYN